MKDCFGREINVGDVVVYATRHGSSQHMNVGKVEATQDKTVKVHVVAGTDWHWTSGRMKWNEARTSYDRVLLEGRNVTLRASGNVVIANGISAEAIHDSVIAQQNANIEKANQRS